MTLRLAGKLRDEDATLVAAYKSLLRDYIDRRPAGLRARLAGTLGKHKSFVSQLTNPVYPMPVPARHIETICEVCRLSPKERRDFLKAYALAHPNRLPAATTARGRPTTTIALELPQLSSLRKQQALEALLRRFVEGLIPILMNSEETDR